MSLTFTTELALHHCISCGIAYGIDAAHERALQQSHQTFYCPNGHPHVFNGEDIATKAARLELALQREQEAKRMALADAQGERLRREKAEAKVRRARKGICLDCNRTFVNVQRHRASKHESK
jgi:hypothetical protein